MLQNAALDGSFAVARQRSDEAPGLGKLDKADIELNVAADAYGLAIGARPAADRVVGRGEFKASGEIVLDKARLDGQ